LVEDDEIYQTLLDSTVELAVNYVTKKATAITDTAMELSSQPQRYASTAARCKKVDTGNFGP
jgi:hypothetical protein